MIQFFIYKTLIMPSLLLIHARNQHLYGELVYNMFMCMLLQAFQDILDLDPQE